MRFSVRIEPASPVPPYEQLRAQLALLISSGRARPGQRLPPIRDLADEVGVANGTVARAYRELERQGILVGRGRAGTFVADDPPIAYEIAQRRQDLEAAASRFAADVVKVGADPTEALELAAASLRQAGL